MKAKILFLLFIISVFFAACGKDDPINPGGDDNKEKKEKEKIPRWIDKTLRQYYYWYQDMPAASTLNYATDPEPFFNSLLSNKDGKDIKNAKGEIVHHYYSTLVDLSKENRTRSISQTNYGYGFDFVLFNVANANFLYAHVSYVAPNTPASEAGIKRGDWIINRNGAAITGSNYASLLGDAACALQVGRWNSASRTISLLPADIQLGTARKIEDNPVYYHSVITSQTGRKVGYLVYNHFTAGNDIDKNAYDNNLRTVSAEFKTAGVNEFVLDLRYNNGGFITCAQLICAMLAPANKLGQSFGYLKYNDKFNPQSKPFTVDNSFLGSSGKNLGFTESSTIYVLTTETTASASEMVINCLRPFMNVVVIGEQTEGKNVGSLEYFSDDDKWEMHPIVCQIFNSQNFSDYANGFTPTYLLDENSNFDYFLPFGDTNEMLLNKALSLIDGVPAVSASKTRATGMQMVKSEYSSLSRRATNGVIIGKGE